MWGYNRRKNTRRKKQYRNMANKLGFISRVGFLNHAQSSCGGYYRVIDTKQVVEFIRPCTDSPENYYMRCRDLRTNKKLNIDYFDLIPANEMEVIALQLVDEEEENRLE